jgi:hypothetical protein
MDTTRKTKHDGYRKALSYSQYQEERIMGTPTFPIPTDIEETIALLNASRLWNLTILRGEFIRLIDGDQLMFKTSNEEEAKAFLAGCFLGTYYGNTLHTIQEMAESGKYSIDREWDDIMAENHTERREHHNNTTSDEPPAVQ